MQEKGENQNVLLGCLEMKPMASLIYFWFPSFLILPLQLFYPSILNALPFNSIALISLGPIISFLVFSRNAWSLLEALPKRPKPYEAYFLLIPYFNIFWLYRIIYPLGKALREEAIKHQFNKLEIGDSFSRIFCHLTWFVPVYLSFVSLRGLVFMNSSVYYGKFLGIVLVGSGVVLFIFWVFVANLLLWHYSKIINIIATHSVMPSSIKS